MDLQNCKCFLRIGSGMKIGNQLYLSLRIRVNSSVSSSFSSYIHGHPIQMKLICLLIAISYMGYIQDPMSFLKLHPPSEFRLTLIGRYILAMITRFSLLNFIEWSKTCGSAVHSAELSYLLYKCQELYVIVTVV